MSDTNDKVYKEQIERAVESLLHAIGENPSREGLVDTPRRVANFWAEFIDYDPGKVSTAFAAVNSADQMVTVSGMRVWSLCEHHLMPFWADVSIAYIPKDKVLGLSKLARIAHKHAHKLQIQERLAEEIAAEVAEHAETEDVAVLVRGQHLCMIMRGIKTEGTMTTTVVKGVFREDAAARTEFLNSVN